MKLYVIITMGICSVLLVGCSEVEQKPDMHKVNCELINIYKDTSVQNAIISQHTLYPYHFVKNGAELNELGLRDLGVLSAHFAKHPGQLNIRHDNISTNLYSDRINFVLDKLKAAGINTRDVVVADGMPGGSGIASEAIIVIMADDNAVSRKYK